MTEGEAAQEEKFLKSCHPRNLFDWPAACILFSNTVEIPVSIVDLKMGSKACGQQM